MLPETALHPGRNSVEIFEVGAGRPADLARDASERRPATARWCRSGRPRRCAWCSRRRSLGAAVRARVRPVRVARLGPRARAPRPLHHRRARRSSRCPRSVDGACCRRRATSCPGAWALIVRARRAARAWCSRSAWPARFARGPAAGATAALATALAEGQVRNGLQGYSEPLLIGLALGAVDMHLSGRTAPGVRPRRARRARAAGAVAARGALCGSTTWRADPRLPAGCSRRASSPSRRSGSGSTGGARASCSTAAAWPAARPPESAALTDRPALTVVTARRRSWSPRRCWRPPSPRPSLALRRRDAVVVTALGGGHGALGGGGGA